MDVDPRTKNVYFVDGQHQNIKMLNGDSSLDGANLLTIVDSREVATTGGEKELIEIDQVAVDPKYKWVIISFLFNW